MAIIIMFLWYRCHTQFMKLKVVGKECNCKTTIPKWPSPVPNSVSYQDFPKVVGRESASEFLGSWLPRRIPLHQPNCWARAPEMASGDHTVKHCLVGSQTHWRLATTTLIHLFYQERMWTSASENCFSEKWVKQWCSTQEKRKATNKAALRENTEESGGSLGLPELTLYLQRILKPNTFQAL